MGRPLLEIVEDLRAANRGHAQFTRDAIASEGFQKIIRAARKGGATDRANLRVLWSAVARMPLEKFSTLLAELREAAMKIASQPLPMGTSSVSSQFQNLDLPRGDGRRDFGKIADQIDTASVSSTAPGEERQ